MAQTVEAVIDEAATIHLLESIKVQEQRRALVTILEDEPIRKINETALLSEKALSEDWNRTEEDEAWLHLQSDQ